MTATTNSLRLWAGLACGAIAAAALPASATPVFDTFGPFPQATFGGSGIPNGNVAASKQIIDGDTTITLALTATQRFSNPPLTNDGLGTFFATPGSNFGGNGESGTEGALWNFNFYIEVEGANGTTPALTDYDFTLFYDFDAGFDTGFGDLGTIDLTASLNGATFPNPNPQMVLEGSQNLLFGFLASPIPGVLDPPAGSFDANATGEYTFAIGVTDGFFPLESVAIDVSVVPEPATALLAGLGVLAVRRRR